jgi:hypothetical protein
MVFPAVQQASGGRESGQKFFALDSKVKERVGFLSSFSLFGAWNFGFISG